MRGTVFGRSILGSLRSGKLRARLSNLRFSGGRSRLRVRVLRVVSGPVGA